MTEIKSEDLQKHFGSPVIAAGKDKDGWTIYKDAKTGERRSFSNSQGIAVKDKAGNIKKDEKGDILYQDEVTGTWFTKGEHKYREEALERKKQKEEDARKKEEEKRIQEKIQDDTRNRKLEEQKFMADENVTKFDVLKEKVETLKEDADPFNWYLKRVLRRDI